LSPLSGKDNGKAAMMDSGRPGLGSQLCCIRAGLPGMTFFAAMKIEAFFSQDHKITDVHFAMLHYFQSMF
jgi:hypothetical protein